MLVRGPPSHRARYPYGLSIRPSIQAALKVPKIITHEKKLDLKFGVEDDIKKFVELMEPLYTNGKLGCLLLQLPPKFGIDLEKLEKFLQILPTQVKFAIEFRDISWLKEETWKILKEL